MTEIPDLASVEDQITYLLDRGMTVPNKGVAELSLNHIGFHRFSAYWKPFESPEGGSAKPSFRRGTSFGVVLNRYLFDQRLRSHFPRSL